MRYSTLTGEMEPWLCLTLSPVGYQHPTWKSIFIYLPVALLVFAAFVSFFASFATVPDTDHDVFLFTSNYAMLPATLRLKTPGFFDLIYHAQFIALLGQLNLDYPAFYSLFASNFAWSFLLFPTHWIPESVTRALFEMGLANSNRRLGDSPRIAVNGTGMNNFAMATGIDINSLFMTSFIVLLVILAGCLLVCLIIWIMVRCMTWYAPQQYKAQNTKVANFTIGKLRNIYGCLYMFANIMLCYRHYSSSIDIVLSTNDDTFFLPIDASCTSGHFALCCSCSRLSHLSGIWIHCICAIGCSSTITCVFGFDITPSLWIIVQHIHGRSLSLLSIRAYTSHCDRSLGGMDQYSRLIPNLGDICLRVLFSFSTPETKAICIKARQHIAYSMWMFSYHHRGIDFCLYRTIWYPRCVKTNGGMGTNHLAFRHVLTGAICCSCA